MGERRGELGEGVDVGPGTFNRNFDRGQAPKKDVGTIALEKAGVNV